VDDETLKKVAALFGEDAVRVVETLKGVHEITDNEIADKTLIRLSLVRKALYRFYTCQTPSCKRYPFEQAFELLFKCPACNKPMIYLNNDRIVEILTRKIEQTKVL
jgi:transcription initiation factor IIE alpha subunit